MKQKILLIVNEFKNIINFRLSLIKYLSNKNIIIEVLCYSNKDSYENKIKELNGIKIYFLTGDSKSTKIFSEIKNIFKLLVLIKSIKPNLIMSFTVKPNIYSSLISKIFRINNLITITGLGSTYIEGGNLNKIIFSLYKIFKNRKTKYIFQNKFDAEVFKQNRITSDIKFIIPGSGVNLDKYKKNLEFLINNKSQTFNFLFIGRLITHKGIEEFYNAAIKLISNSNKKLKFLVVGQYDKFDQYSIDQTLYNKIHKNENFELVGYTSNVTKYILKSNCILLSSKREGMPMALLEAGSIGRALIASDVPGCNEIVIDNFNGFKYKSGNIEDLFNKMTKMINLSQKQILRFSYNSHKHISINFSSKIINDKYYKIIQENL
ncbi:MAG: hypothetical protein CMK44_00680 [Porticoccus sp.]|nr:hypothetical protein [Porticoccus sp.]